MIFREIGTKNVHSKAKIVIRNNFYMWQHVQIHHFLKHYYVIKDLQSPVTKAL